MGKLIQPGWHGEPEQPTRKINMKVEVGTYKTDRHIAVIGQPTAFYIWVRKNREDTGRCSNWIRGDLPLYNKLAETLRKNKTEFIELATTMFKEHT